MSGSSMNYRRLSFDGFVFKVLMIVVLYSASTGFLWFKVTFELPRQIAAYDALRSQEIRFEQEFASLPETEKSIKVHQAMEVFAEENTHYLKRYYQELYYQQKNKGGYDN